MQTRWFLVVMTLIGTTLACNYPLNNNNPTITQVISVAVNPPSGTGSFTLEVTYIAFTDDDRLPEPITCYYVTPFGATIPIGSVTPPVWKINRSATTLTGTLAYSVSAPGDYTATCENDSSIYKASANFTVERILEATGERTLYQSYYTQAGDKISACTDPVQVTLTFQPDGTASLFTDGPARFGENCENNLDKNNPLHMQWTWTGVDDPKTETIVFSTCNYVPGSGQIRYSGGVITGSATCPNPGHNELKTTITLK